MPIEPPQSLSYPNGTDLELKGPYRTRYAQLTTLNKCQTIPTLSYHSGPISPFVKLIDLSAVAGPAYKDLPATVSIVWYEDAGCKAARAGAVGEC